MIYIVIHALVVLLIGYVIFRIKKHRHPIQFVDKHVLITGGSSGIGECMAYLYSALGAFVTIASEQAANVAFEIIMDKILVRRSKEEMQIS